MKVRRMFQKILVVSDLIFQAAIVAIVSVVLMFTASLAKASEGHTVSTTGVEPFFPDGTYMESVTTPDSFLGYTLGSKPVDHDETFQYVSYLAEASPRVQLHEFGKSHEGRTLFYVVISSESNMSRLEELQEAIGKLADPRRLTGEGEARSLIEGTPAVCWLGYSIHGDELSSTECALQVAYQLAAGTDTLTEKLLRELIILINPLQNPDGRERFVGQIQQLAGTVPNPDVQSLQHRGFWPWGRGNHYLFDLNRDWFALVQPETRSQVPVILDWNPQLFVDSHEMGGLNTYLFSPPREPFNPNITDRQLKWWKIFSRDQAEAFDRYGWSYYTGEWAEEWYPGYANSWALYTGAIGILYEQAGVDGSLVKQRDGSILTYRESIHHHFVSSMANLTTAANRRVELLRDYYEEKRVSLEDQPHGTPQAFIFVPGEKSMRTADFIERLLLQDVEVYVSEEIFNSRNLHDIWGNFFSSKSFPEGTVILPLDQPMRPLIKTILEFDPRMKSSFLTKERRKLEKEGGTSIYDVTAWSLPMAYDLEAYWTEKPIAVKKKLVTQPELPRGSVTHVQPQYGWLIDSKGDGIVYAFLELFRKECTVRVAVEPFRIEGVSFSKGSILLRRLENPDDVHETLEQVAEKTGVTVYGVNTALCDEGPDLGGGKYRLLKEPRMGIFAGMPVSTTGYGALWHLLDNEFEFRFSSLDIGAFTRMDLDKYDVLVLPHVWGGGEAYQEIVGKGGIKKLKTWIEGGGTLVAVGSASAFAADTSVGLSRVRLHRHILDKIDEYDEAVAKERGAELAAVDSIALWEGVPRDESQQEAKEETTSPGKSGEIKERAEEDEYLRRFRPSGCIVRADLDEEHWLTSGMDKKVPIILSTPYAFLSKRPIETAARFAEPDSLRLSGLLWPEARERWASTAYLTRERLGKGQIILFAGDPIFRGYFRGSMRLLMNALLLGPGFGTSRTTPW